MDKLLVKGRQVRATGKIDDLFGGRGHQPHQPYHQ
jgi:hypothetical protein